MKMAELVKQFQLKFPELTKAMRENNHHWDSQNLNPYHLESDTFNHTMCVCIVAEQRNVSDLVKIACLLHDVGKPMSTTRVEDTKKVRMFGHEGMGVFIGLDFLNTLDLSKEDKAEVCKLISLHTYIYQQMRNSEGWEREVAKTFAGEVEFLKNLIQMNACDALGRFSEKENRELWNDAENYFSPLVHMVNPVIYPRQTKGTATILVGPPMSGKSTWIKKNAKDAVVLCRDEVIMELGKGKAYNEAFRSVDQDEVNRIYDLRKKESLKLGKDLVFDLTHMSEKSRRKSLAGIPKDMKRVAVVFLTSYNTLKERNDKRTKEENKTIPQRVLEMMMGQFSVPLRSEGFDEIVYVVNGE